ncbi:MAG: sugar phosphate isomerase/epimerase family protein [Opitutales bacterium]
MQLAISNIAWSAEDEAALLPQLQARGVRGIEVAPTKIQPSWDAITPESVREYRTRLDDAGLHIPALQAIVFGRADLQFFDPQTHAAFGEHIRRVAGIAHQLGAQVLVFGAPKNRKRGQIAFHEAWSMAVEFGGKLAEICQAEGVVLGWEHNPVEYGCDFVTNHADARGLVDAIGSPGLQLHLDAAGLHLCGGDIARQIAEVGPFCHYHASEPMLEPLTGDSVGQAQALRAVAATGCVEWVSIEMKTPEHRDSVFESIDLIRTALESVPAGSK